MSIRCFLRALRPAVTHFPHRCAPALVALALAAPALGQPSSVGQWDPPPGPDGYDWPLAAIHAVHLHTGDILVWDTHNTDPLNDPKLWNPADGNFTDVPTDSDLFCAGHAALADGSVLVAGGGAGGQGTTETTIYNSASPSPWNLVEPMNYARWYPTCTTLPNGKILAIAGKDGGGVHVRIPEIYDPAIDAWQELGFLAEKVLRTYPYMFVVPHADPLVHKVFFAGPGPVNDRSTWTLDVNAESWQFVDDSPFNGLRGSAVMYEPGKVLKVGGSTDGSFENEAATIDLNDPTPMWFSEAPMQEARNELNLVLLADGTVLAVGGEESDEPVFTPELYDPQTGFWDSMEDMTKERGHHSIALLLADGKVLAAGGDPGNPDAESAEIFSPAYLFKAGGGDADRPLIGFAPTAVIYDTSFSVILSRQSPVSRAQIEKVTFVRLAAVTHRFDQNQRYLSLAVQTDPSQPTGLVVEAPANANLAPPGYYMLFLISVDGAPSIAKYVKLIPPPIS